MSTIDLHTDGDTRKIREVLYKEQDSTDAMTGLDLDPSKACLDHDHLTQLVRGVLHRNVNSLLGVIENNYSRHLKSWYPYDLPMFLRQCADYLENKDDTRWYHKSWKKRVQADYNKLNEASKDSVLSGLDYPTGINGKERKDRFKQLVLDRSLGFEKISKVINKVNKEQNEAQ